MALNSVCCLSPCVFVVLLVVHIQLNALNCDWRLMSRMTGKPRPLLGRKLNPACFPDSQFVLNC